MSAYSMEHISKVEIKDLQGLVHTYDISAGQTLAMTWTGEAPDIYVEVHHIAGAAPDMFQRFQWMKFTRKIDNQA